MPRGCCNSRPSTPLRKKDRDKDERDDERGEDDGVTDFDAGIEDDLQRWTTLAFRILMIPPEPTKNILHVNHRVVHESANRDGHAAQRHRVDGRAEPFQREHCHHERQRNGCECDERGAEIGEEQQNHNKHEENPVD